MTCNTGTAQQGGTVTYTIEKDITGWLVLDGETNTFDIAEVMTPVTALGATVVPPDFNVENNPDFVNSIEVTSTDPMTIVYDVKNEAVWSDGEPIDVADFEWIWKISNGVDCPDCGVASTSGYEQIKSIEADSTGKKITVTFDTPYADWKGLFTGLYPAHLAAEQGSLDTPEGLLAGYNWFNDLDNVPDWSGGPYIITDFVDGVSVTMEPNPKWYGAVKPKLDKLIFRIVKDQSAEVPALQAGDVNCIYPQPNLDIVNAVKQVPGVSYVASQGLIWEHFDLNTANPLFQDKALREAIFTAVDREDIIAKTVGQFTEGLTPLGSHNFVPGQAGYKDLVTASGQGSGDIDKAKSILQTAGYTGIGTDLKTPSGADVSFRFNYSEGNTLRQQTGELFQTYMKDLGIDVTLSPGSLGTMLDTHDFDMIIFAWVGTPFPYGGALQLWGSDSESNYAGFKSDESDELLAQAATEADSAVADDLLNQSNELLVEQATTLPLFQKPTFLACYDNIVNIRDNASTASPVYNVQEWGIRAT